MGKTRGTTIRSLMLSMLTMFFIVNFAYASPNIPVSDEDTILVDKQPDMKIPYNKIARAVIKKLFSFDSERLMTFGEEHQGHVARSFTDYVDRTRTRFKVKSDTVEVEFKLQF